MTTALGVRVRGVNRANSLASQWQERLIDVFRPFVGTKIFKADGELLAKIKKLVGELGMPNDVHTQFYHSKSNYELRYVVKTCESEQGVAYYHETTIPIGELDRGALISLSVATKYRTDYTADEVVAKRQFYRDAKRAADEIRNSLYPFGESDI